MAPLPKRKHSTMRKGKRRAERAETLSAFIYCKNCNKPKLPHRICTFCGQ